MKDRRLRSLLFAAFTLLFVCLFISGAPRLIAAEHIDHEPAVRLVPALLCSMPSASAQGEADAREYHTGGTVQEASALVQNARRSLNVMIARTDANGNVLSEASYMRSVYHAFALGDGFA